MELVKYKVLKDGFILGDHHKKDAVIELNEKQAKLFINDGTIEVASKTKKTSSSKANGQGSKGADAE